MNVDMEMYVRGSFDSAHFLPLYDGKCSKVHGHTFRYKICVTGKLNKETGMIIDFKKVEQELDTVICELDHNNLNTILEIPTCENLLLYLREKLNKSKLKDNWRWITLWETEKYGGIIYA